LDQILVCYTIKRALNGDQRAADKLEENASEKVAGLHKDAEERLARLQNSDSLVAIRKNASAERTEGTAQLSDFKSWCERGESNPYGCIVNY
jgi:DNA primase catalytic subunit